MYSIKPLDRTTICDAAEQTGLVLTVEDHFPEGGIGEAVAAALSNMPTPVHIQAVRHRPVSGSPERLLEEHGLSARAITETVEGLLLRQKGLKH
jgi:transketolase